MTQETEDTLIKLARYRINDARVKADRSQAEVSASVGVSPPQYSRLESGQGEMSLRQFIRTCLALNLDPGEVLTRRSLSPDETKARLTMYETAFAELQTKLAGKKDAWE